MFPYRSALFRESIMAFLKNIPELRRINGRWVIDPFVPTQPAFDWPKIRFRTATVYVVECAGFHKIGITNEFEKRFRGLDYANPLPVVKVATRTVPLAGLAYAEAWLHMKLAEYRVKGEWFAVSRQQAVALLPHAVRRACAYADHCRDWDLAFGH